MGTDFDAALGVAGFTVSVFTGMALLGGREEWLAAAGAVTTGLAVTGAATAFAVGFSVAFGAAFAGVFATGFAGAFVGVFAAGFGVTLTGILAGTLATGFAGALARGFAGALAAGFAGALSVFGAGDLLVPAFVGFFAAGAGVFLLLLLSAVEAIAIPSGELNAIYTKKRIPGQPRSVMLSGKC